MAYSVYVFSLMVRTYLQWFFLTRASHSECFKESSIPVG